MTDDEREAVKRIAESDLPAAPIARRLLDPEEADMAVAHG